MCHRWPPTCPLTPWILRLLAHAEDRYKVASAVPDNANEVTKDTATRLFPHTNTLEVTKDTATRLFPHTNTLEVTKDTATRLFCQTTNNGASTTT
jgi:hypothetical protein